MDGGDGHSISIFDRVLGNQIANTARRSIENELDKTTHTLPNRHVVVDGLPVSDALAECSKKVHRPVERALRHSALFQTKPADKAPIDALNRFTLRAGPGSVGSGTFGKGHGVVQCLGRHTKNRVAPGALQILSRNLEDTIIRIY